MPELAVLIPTRGRPDNIRKVISAWDFTNAWDNADMILLVDADDPQIQGYHEVADKFWQHTGDGSSDTALTIIEIPAWAPMVHKLNAAARDMAGRYWALGFAGDDHLPQTIGWAKHYLTVLREMGTGMVYSDDGYQGVKLSTEWAVTSDVVRALGRMVPAPVEHMYCDNSMMDLYGGAGALRWSPEVRIEHMHPSVNKAPTDAQYQRVNHRDQFRKDRAFYEQWKRDGMAADVAALRSLRVGMGDIPAPVATPPTARTPVPPARPVRLPRHQQPRARSAPVQPPVQPPRHFDQVRAATPPDIMMALADFASQVSTGHEIVELGVFCGRTALQLAWGARQGNRAHVTGVDAWALPGNTYAPPFTDDESRRWAEHWVQTLGYADSVTLVNDFSVNVAAAWSGRPVGLLFVDADHSVEGCRADILGWAPHLYFCARIAVDDYGHPDWPGVREAVDGLVADGFLEPIQIFHDRLAVTTLTAAAVAGLVANTELLHHPEAEMFPTVPCDGTCDTPADQPHSHHLVRAITGEGVFPSPGPVVEDELTAPELPIFGAVSPVAVDAEFAAEWNRVDPEPAGELHTEVASEVPSNSPGRTFVSAGELPDVPAGTMIDTLSMAYLKELAKVRGIVLSTRVHKKSETLQALTEGR